MPTKATSLEQIQKSGTLPELLAWRAAHQPDRQAFVFLSDGEQQSLTYGELYAQAQKIASFLRDSRQPGERVLLFFPPGLAYISAFLGCLQAGMTAVPLFPPRFNEKVSRVAGILENCGAKAALTTGALCDPIRSCLSGTLFAQQLELLTAADWCDAALDGQPLAVEPGDLAFLQYTSGSTGTPKGVMVTHANLMANQGSIAAGFRTTTHDIGLNWLPLYHDMGLIGTVLHPLYQGFKSILFPSTDFVRDPLSWLDAISQHRATVCGGPNFAYELCAEKCNAQRLEKLDLSPWRIAFNGAEPVRAEVLDLFSETFTAKGFDRNAFFPCYGMAEATLFISGAAPDQGPVIGHFQKEALADNRAVVDPTDSAVPLVSCGHCRPDHRVLIVEPADGRVLPDSHIGEICFQGPSVAVGYWGMAQESERLFNTDLSDDPMPFLRTGDLGFQQNGQLYITGRLKDLIIVRGRNHYPQDIEAAATQSHKALVNGGCAAFTVEEKSELHLVVVAEIRRTALRDLQVAQVVEAMRAGVVDNHQLRLHAVVLVKQGGVPKTSSGKIKRYACRDRYLDGTLNHIEVAVQERAFTQSVDVPQRAVLLGQTVEQRVAALTAYLCAIAAAALNIEYSEVGHSSSLGSLGADSLTVLGLQHRLNTELAMNLPIRTFFESKSLLDLAQVAERNLERPVNQRTNSEQGNQYALAYNQQALWFLHQLSPLSGAYNIAIAAKIRTGLDQGALKRSIEILQQRHAQLRTVFQSHEQVPYQRVFADATLDFDVLEDNSDPKTLLADEAARPFDLENQLPLRVRLLKNDRHETYLLLSIHHIAGDFWSLLVLLDELRRVYGSEMDGTDAQLEPPVWHYADYVAQQQLEVGDMDAALAYWSRKLSGDLPVLDLPTSRIRPKVQSFVGASAAFSVEPQTSRRLQQLARAHGVTLHTLLLSAYQGFLNRYTNQDDILVGTPTSGRTDARFDEVVGYFINPVVLRADFSEKPCFLDLLERNKSDMVEVLSQQSVPFHLLVDHLKVIRDPSRSPLFQTMFTLLAPHRYSECTPFALRQEGEIVALGPLVLESINLPQRFSQFDLALSMGGHGDALAGFFEYAVEIIDETCVTAMIANFKHFLASIVAAPEQPIADLSLLSEADRHLLLVTCNDTNRDYARDIPVYKSFEVLAEKQPLAVAVVHEHQTLTYGELNERANRLAHYLIRLGVGPETPVAVFTHRNLEMIVAVLAIHKAGGAYLPMDPAYPVQRMAFMLEDTAVRIILTHGDLEAKIPASGIPIFALDQGWKRLARLPSTNPEAQLNGDNLAVMIYTSGSTGRPKSVGVTHRNITAFVDWSERQFLPQHRAAILGSTSLCFDLSVFEIFGSLGLGGRLILVENLLALPGSVAAHQVTLINTVPSAANVLIGMAELPSSVRVVSLAGEPLKKVLVQKLYQYPNIEVVYNLYGPTEDTVFSTAAALPRDEDIPVSIGVPIDHTKAYVLDQRLQPLPVDFPGELYLSGEQTARGYLGRPGLTADRFLPNHLSDKSGTRIYRTGDVVRRLSDGSLSFLGRVDHQVKISGFRIELGEIENALLAHPNVREVVVVAADGPGGVKQLTAYLSTCDGRELTGLRPFLKQSLPAYMVPAFFVFLERLPLSANNKIDLKHLPKPALVQRGLPAPPRNETEQKLAVIWSEILGTKAVDIQANFFESGGNSLLAARVVSRVRTEFSVALSLEDLFSDSSIAALAQRITTKKDALVHLQDSDSQDLVEIDL